MLRCPIFVVAALAIVELRDGARLPLSRTDRDRVQRALVDGVAPGQRGRLRARRNP